MVFPDIALFLLSTQSLPPQHHQKGENKKDVLLALVHVKNANNNQRESPLTSLVNVNQEHVYRCGKKPTAGKKKSKQLVKMLSVLQSGKINYQTLLLFSTIRKRSPCSAFWLRTQQQIPWELPVMTSGRCYKNKKGTNCQTLHKMRSWHALSPNGPVLEVHSPCFHKDPVVFCLF